MSYYEGVGARRIADSLALLALQKERDFLREQIKGGELCGDSNKEYAAKKLEDVETAIERLVERLAK